MSRLVLDQHDSPSSSDLFVRSCDFSRQVSFPSLGWILTLRNRRSIGFRSYLYLGLCFFNSIGSFILVVARIGLESFLSPIFPPSSPLSLVHWSAPFPRDHVPTPWGSCLPFPLSALYLCHAMAHKSSYDMSSRVLITLGRSRVI